MKISVQTDNVMMLKEVIKHCDEVRFGSEFCEFKVPSIETLEEACTLTKCAGKNFTYITPRVSNLGLKKIREHLYFLNEDENISVVANDYGVLNILGQYSNLKPRLGRQLIYIPARCPWKDFTPYELGFMGKRRISRIFYQTSLNCVQTISFFKGLRVEGVDVDHIPQSFQSFYSLVRSGLNLSVHLNLIPVAVTRKCHTARFLGEKSLETCSRPCDKRAFLLKHDVLGVQLVLQGNVIFRPANPSRKQINELCKNGIDDFVITMGPATKIKSQNDIESFIQDL